MTEDQKERYKHLSTKDRTRFEVQRRKHKQCVKTGQKCTCKQTHSNLDSDQQLKIQNCPSSHLEHIAAIQKPVKFGVKTSPTQKKEVDAAKPQPEVKQSKPRGRPPKKPPQQQPIEQKAASTKTNSIRIQNQTLIKQ